MTASNKGQRKTTAAVVGDSVGFAHFLIANAVLIIGEYSTYFNFVAKVHGGMEFVYRYIDTPVYTLLRPFEKHFVSDPMFTYIFAELVIGLSSILYGAIAFGMVKIVAASGD